jgi:hypothetical protein
MAVPEEHRRRSAPISSGGTEPGAKSGSGRDSAHFDRLEALRPIRQVELDDLSVIEGAESVQLDGGVVHERVGNPFELGDDPEALFYVEPLDCSGRHDGLSLFSTGRVLSESFPACRGRPPTWERADCHPSTETLLPKKSLPLASLRTAWKSVRNRSSDAVYTTWQHACPRCLIRNTDRGSRAA